MRRLILQNASGETVAVVVNAEVPCVGDTIRGVWGDSVQPRFRVLAVEHTARHESGTSSPRSSTRTTPSSS